MEADFVTILFFIVVLMLGVYVLFAPSEDVKELKPTKRKSTKTKAKVK